jgi:hypothetical protein
MKSLLTVNRKEPPVRERVDMYDYYGYTTKDNGMMYCRQVIGSAKEVVEGLLLQR